MPSIMGRPFAGFTQKSFVRLVVLAPTDEPKPKTSDNQLNKLIIAP